jgi:hypothetical protein
MESENNDLKRRLGKALKVAEKLKKQSLIEDKVKTELVKRNDVLKKRCDFQASKLQKVLEDADQLNTYLESVLSHPKLQSKYYPVPKMSALNFFCA